MSSVRLSRTPEKLRPATLTTLRRRHPEAGVTLRRFRPIQVERFGVRWLDLLHARYHNDDLFFSDGWGDPETLALPLVQKLAPAPADASKVEPGDSVRVLRFESPWSVKLPQASKIAEALVVLPDEWNYQTPVCIQLAATGDEGFSERKRVVATPLRELGIGSVILENPFYGCRRPTDQNKTYLRTVSDLWIMGLAIVAEARALLGWLRGQGFQNLGVCGVSMGGAMAGQTVALTSEPLAMCACIAPHCATPVFLEGVLSNYVNWEALGGEAGRKALAEQLDGSDLRLFPPPNRPDACVWLAAKKDAYVDPSSSQLAAESWPGSKLRWLNSGHVGTAMFYKGQYIQKIAKSFSFLAGAPKSDVAWLP
jgi:Alpha/beta hydrolase domain containing 18